MATFANAQFSSLMMNWMDVLRSSTSLFKVAETASPSDANKLSLPSSSSSSGDAKKAKRSKKKQQSKNKKNKKGSRSKKKPSLSSKGSRQRLGVFETSTNTSNELLVELQHGNEGFDLHLGQTVCDDSRPSMGEEAQSYFLMRHSLSYPGPLQTMLAGPMAAVSGGYGYRVSAEAVHRDKYVLVGTYSGNTVEGVWEHTWSRRVKSHLTFVAGFESAQQRQMAAMMAQQQGLPPMAANESKFPAAISYIDYCGRHWSTRVHLDMMNNQLSLSLNRRLYSISPSLQVGARIVSSYEKRKSLLEFGGKYQWRANGTEGAKEGASRAGLNTVESLYNMESRTVQLMYTHNVTDNAAMTARLMWNTKNVNQLMASFGYKYQFGRHMGAAKSICGEIAGDGNFRQMLTFPVLGNMICKLYAEINHFLSPQQVQQGQFPHKFGFQLNIHL